MVSERQQHRVSKLPPRGQYSLAEAETPTPTAEEIDRLRAAALLPEQLLHGGEIIILLLKPSPWYIVLEPLRFWIVELVLLIAGLWLIQRGYSLPLDSADLILLAMGVAGARLAWQFLEWLSRIYVLTDRRIITVSGVLRVQIFETKLQKIQHTVALFSIRERLFGLGTIGFATAGTATMETTWRMIAKPLEVHQKVVETLNRYR